MPSQEPPVILQGHDIGLGQIGNLIVHPLFVGHVCTGLFFKTGLWGCRCCLRITCSGTLWLSSVQRIELVLIASSDVLRSGACGPPSGSQRQVKHWASAGPGSQYFTHKTSALNRTQTETYRIETTSPHSHRPSRGPDQTTCIETS